MKKYNLNDLVEFDSKRFNPRVLINEPAFRMVLITLLAGQSIPEHRTPGSVTIYAMRGHVSLSEGEQPFQLHAGEVANLDESEKHLVHAHQDSVLLVLARGARKESDVPLDISEVLDLREVPRPQRHPMIFAKFDALVPGASLRLLNDHDPIPLNRQFDMVRPGEALWEYLKRGPDLFSIRITRIAAASALDVPVLVSAQQPQLQPSKT